MELPDLAHEASVHPLAMKPALHGPAAQTPAKLPSLHASKSQEEFDKTHTATFCATKAGNGYKVVVNGVWFYASKRQLMELVSGRQKACTFRTIGDD